MSHHSHHGSPRIGVAVLKPFTDRILIGPILAGEVLIDARHTFGPRAIVGIEQPALQDRDAQSSEISGRDAADVSMRSRLARGGWLAFNLERRRRISSRKWQRISGP